MEWDGRARSEGNGTARSPAPGLESTVRPLVPQMLVNGLSQRSRPCASGPLINPNAGVRARGHRDQGSSSSGRRWGPAPSSGSSWGPSGVPVSSHLAASSAPAPCFASSVSCSILRRCLHGGQTTLLSKLCGCSRLRDETTLPAQHRRLFFLLVRQGLAVAGVAEREGDTAW